MPKELNLVLLMIYNFLVIIVETLKHKYSHSPLHEFLYFLNKLTSTIKNPMANASL